MEVDDFPAFRLSSEDEGSAADLFRLVQVEGDDCAIAARLDSCPGWGDVQGCFASGSGSFEDRPECRFCFGSSIRPVRVALVWVEDGYVVGQARRETLPIKAIEGVQEVGYRLLDCGYVCQRIPPGL